MTNFKKFATSLFPLWKFCQGTTPYLRRCNSASTGPIYFIYGLKERSRRVLRACKVSSQLTAKFFVKIKKFVFFVTGQRTKIDIFAIFFLKFGKSYVPKTYISIKIHCF